MNAANGSGPVDRTVGRSQRISEARKAQPLDELERKALKSARRDIWTQEQIDLIEVVARDMHRRFGDA